MSPPRRSTAKRHAFLQLMSAQCQATGTTVLVVSHDGSLQPLFDRTISLSEINQAGAGHA